MGGKEERVLLGRGAYMVADHDVVVFTIERRRLRVELVFRAVGWCAGVGVVGGVAEPPAGGSSDGFAKVVRHIAPGAGALTGALGDVAGRTHGRHAAGSRTRNAERRMSSE